MINRKFEMTFYFNNLKEEKKQSQNLSYFKLNQNYLKQLKKAYISFKITSVRKIHLAIISMNLDIISVDKSFHKL